MSSTFHSMGREFSSVALVHPLQKSNSMPCGSQTICLQDFKDYVFSGSLLHSNCDKEKYYNWGTTDRGTKVSTSATGDKRGERRTTPSLPPASAGADVHARHRRLRGGVCGPRQNAGHQRGRRLPDLAASPSQSGFDHSHGSRSFSLQFRLGARFDGPDSSAGFAAAGSGRRTPHRSAISKAARLNCKLLVRVFLKFRLACSQVEAICSSTLHIEPVISAG
jgi:hypothetical protein